MSDLEEYVSLVLHVIMDVPYHLLDVVLLVLLITLVVCSLEAGLVLVGIRGHQTLYGDQNRF